MALSGAVNAAFPQFMKAGGKVADWAVAKLAPPALELVKDMASRILQQRSSVTGEALQDFTR